MSATLDPAGGPPVDVLIVGSGASAVQAACPLVEAGLSVRMLDFGLQDTHYAERIPDGSFADLRSSDPEQHRYLLGEEFEGIPLEQPAAGAQLTPPRQFVAREAAARTPIASTSFFPLESLARGGLAEAWGAGCAPFDDRDLLGTTLDRAALESHYEAVASRIGISGARDDLAPFFGDLRSLQSPLRLDLNARTILDRYGRRRASLNPRGFFLGRPRLAVLTQDFDGRRATRYRDVEFWSDRDRNVYRPRFTLERLEARRNFDYRPGLLVHDFASTDGGVAVRAARSVDGLTELHRARSLVLAAGTLGTTRIALRSLGRYGQRVPLVCNPHTYVPMLNLAMLGRGGDEPRHSLAQLCCAYRSDSGDVTVGYVHSYRSLMLFRLLPHSPLSLRDGVGVFRRLMPALTILILQHADEPGAEKYCRLRRGDGGAPDTLEIEYTPTPGAAPGRERVERGVLGGFRRLGCFPLRRIHSGNATSIHYAGTLPLCTEERELTCAPDGRLRGAREVYVADGSVFGRLPSKGLTFTMMANADRIGSALARRLVG